MYKSSCQNIIQIETTHNIYASNLSLYTQEINKKNKNCKNIKQGNNIEEQGNMKSQNNSIFVWYLCN
jgi:hypothetical protein